MKPKMNQETRIGNKMIVMKLADLTPAEFNPRKIDEDGLIRLTKSLHEFGNLQPVVFNLQSKKLLAGHQRVKALSKLGNTETEVWCIDLDPVKEKAAIIQLNKSSGDWDYSMLKELLLELDNGEFDMDLTGFPQHEIENLMAQFHVPEMNKELDENSLSETNEECPKCGFKWNK